MKATQAIKVGEEFDVTVGFSDPDTGAPLEMKSTLTWGATDLGVVAIVPDPTDPFKAVIKSTDTAGSCDVSVSANVMFDGNVVNAADLFGVTTGSVTPPPPPRAPKVSFTFGSPRPRT